MHDETPDNPDNEPMIGNETSVFDAVEVPTHQPTRTVPTIPAAAPAAAAPTAHVAAPAVQRPSRMWMLAAAAAGVIGFLGAALAVSGGSSDRPTVGDTAEETGDDAPDVLGDTEVPVPDQPEISAHDETADDVGTPGPIGDGATETDDTPDPVTDADPEPAAEPEADPEPAADPEPEADPEPAADPEPEADPEPAADPEPEADPAADPEDDDDPDGDPDPFPGWDTPLDILPLPTLPPWEPPGDFLPPPTIPELPFDFPVDLVIPTIPPGPYPEPPVFPTGFLGEIVVLPEFGFDS